MAMLNKFSAMVEEMEALLKENAAERAAAIAEFNKATDHLLHEHKESQDRRLEQFKNDSNAILAKYNAKLDKL